MIAKLAIYFRGRQTFPLNAPKNAFHGNAFLFSDLSVSKGLCPIPFPFSPFTFLKPQMKFSQFLLLLLLLLLLLFFFSFLKMVAQTCFILTFKMLMNADIIITKNN